jgi:hypothetical protein
LFPPEACQTWHERDLQSEGERRRLTNIFASNATRWWRRVTSIADTTRTTTSNFAPSADPERKRRQIGLNLCVHLFTASAATKRNSEQRLYLNLGSQFLLAFKLRIATASKRSRCRTFRNCQYPGVRLRWRRLDGEARDDHTSCWSELDLNFRHPSPRRFLG